MIAVTGRSRAREERDVESHNESDKHATMDPSTPGPSVGAEASSRPAPVRLAGGVPGQCVPGPHGGFWSLQVTGLRNNLISMSARRARGFPRPRHRLAPILKVTGPRPEAERFRRFGCFFSLAGSCFFCPAAVPIRLRGCENKNLALGILSASVSSTKADASLLCRCFPAPRSPPLHQRLLMGADIIYATGMTGPDKLALRQ